MSEAQSIEDIEVEENEVPNFSEVVNYNPLAEPW
jgi:hypothetical protein